MTGKAQRNGWRRAQKTEMAAERSEARSETHTIFFSKRMARNKNSVSSNLSFWKTRAKPDSASVRCSRLRLRKS